MRTKNITVFLFLIILVVACKKTPETLTTTNKIIIGASTVSSVGYFTASGTTQVNSLGGNTISEHGHCWSTNPNPDMNDSHSSMGQLSSPAAFTSDLSDLLAATKYYITPYLKYQYGIIYGVQIEFTTLQVPTVLTVTTDTASNITQTTATSGGNVISNGGDTVTARGVCWNTSPEPTLTNSYTIDSGGTGEFTSNLTGLIPDTLYHVRAYATNSAGTVYGNEITFTTLSNVTLPTVTTYDAINITQTTATSGGNVTSDGGDTVTARGVCWSTSPDPTLTNSYTIDGGGTGEFTSNLTGLIPDTTYYVRAYATNTVGTAYGIDVSFTTLQPWQCGDTTNYEGQVYNTVQIGSQCWFKENLNIGTLINDGQNQTNNSTIEKYCYIDLESNCDTYGGLYQWDEMMQYVIVQGVQGICPTGWHIPTDEEWKILEGTVDSQYGVYNSIWNLEGWRGFDAGLNMKSTSGWFQNGNGTNSSGFTALPGGGRHSYGGFYGLTSTASFWSSSFYSQIDKLAWGRRVSYGFEIVHRGSHDWASGFSVRCLKN